MGFSLPEGLKITWLGHSCFHIVTPGGKHLLFDPFLTYNPMTPPELKSVDTLDLMLVSHGHMDHTADVVPLAQKTGCPIVGMVELLGWFGSQGVDGSQLHEMNKGGSLRFPDLGLTVTITHAFHSSSGESAENPPVYTGEPTGFVVTLDDGFAFYFAGDTDIFGDMALISEIWNPKLAFLPIGDRFTMNPHTAAMAVTLMPTLEAVIPMHYGTFPLLTGTPDVFEKQVESTGSGVAVLTMSPGQTLG